MKLFTLLAVVSLATSANASSVKNSKLGKALGGDASSTKERLGGSSQDSSNTGKNVKTPGVLLSTGGAVSQRLADVLSSKGTLAKKGDDQSSSQGTSDLAQAPVKDAASSVSVTGRTVGSALEGTSKSQTLKLGVDTAKSVGTSVSTAARRVGVALWNSFSISTQGASKAVSSVTNQENPLSVSSDTVRDAFGELLSVDNVQKANKAKYKYLLMAKAQRSDLNAGLDFEDAARGFAEVAYSIDSNLSEKELALVIDIAVALEEGQVTLEELASL